MRTDKKSSQKADKKSHSRAHNRGVVGYSKKSALLEEAITHMNTGKYGRSSAALKELLTLDPHNTEARRLFATLHLRLGSLVTARQAFESLANEAIGRQDFWLAESLLREYLAAGPRCVPFLELLAHVHEEKGDSMAAVAELGKAIEILIEGPDSEHPNKPSQLYAKVRELAPASPVAFQYASLFDIQTGELLVPHPQAPAAETSLEIDSSQPQGETFFATEEAKAADVMPWEQFDGTSPIQETPPPTSSNSVVESLDVPDVLIDAAPVGLAPQELEIIPSESAGPIQEADNEEGVAPSFLEERTRDVERDITSSVGSPELSSPMPWEQIENSTVRIEEATPSSGSESVLAPSRSSTTQSESVSDHLLTPSPVSDPTEPSESIFAT
ncbi:MAG: tetratricopeptide repeat protein, partial [Nitrospirales bacterium]